MAKFRTHYDHLHISENASQDDIRTAFKSCFLKYHPGKFCGNKQRAARFMQTVKDSYTVLSDPEKRKDHDKWIAENRQLADQEFDGQPQDEQNFAPGTSEIEHLIPHETIIPAKNSTESRNPSRWKTPAIAVLLFALGYAGWWSIQRQGLQVPIIADWLNDSKEGFEFNVENKCRYPISLLIRYNDLNGEWHFEGWWDVEPGGSFYLEDENGKRLTSSNSVWYYYASTTAGSHIEWKGKDRFSFNGWGKIPMIEMIDRDGDSEWSISCDN